MCPPKPNTKKYRSQIRQIVLRKSNVGAFAIQCAEVGEAVVAGDIQKVQRIIPCLGLKGINPVVYVL